LNKIIADLQQVTKINSTVGLSGFESWLSNKEETLWVSFLFHPVCLEQSLVLVRYTITLNGFLNSLIMRPWMQAMLLYIRQRGIPLILIVCLFVCQRRAEGWCASGRSSAGTIPPADNQWRKPPCHKAVLE
jgi:hypothetical protein